MLRNTAKGSKQRQVSQPMQRRRRYEFLYRFRRTRNTIAYITISSKTLKFIQLFFFLCPTLSRVGGELASFYSDGKKTTYDSSDFEKHINNSELRTSEWSKSSCDIRRHKQLHSQKFSTNCDPP